MTLPSPTWSCWTNVRSMNEIQPLWKYPSLGHPITPTMTVKTDKPNVTARIIMNLMPETNNNSYIHEWPIYKKATLYTRHKFHTLPVGPHAPNVTIRTTGQSTVGPSHPAQADLAQMTADMTMLDTTITALKTQKRGHNNFWRPLNPAHKVLLHLPQPKWPKWRLICDKEFQIYHTSYFLIICGHSINRTTATIVQIKKRYHCIYLKFLHFELSHLEQTAAS